MNNQAGQDRKASEHPKSQRIRVAHWAMSGLFFHATILCHSLGKDFFVPIVFAFLLALMFSGRSTSFQ